MFVYVDGPVVAEALADRAGLLASRTTKSLREVDRVAVLVEDHLGVLGVVHAALAEAQLVLRVVGGERVVLAPLVDPHSSSRGWSTRISGMPDRLHFTGNDEADRLLADEPMALLIGFALDQQVPVPTAFTGPLKLKQRLGTLDPGRIAKTDPAKLEAAFREKPAIHRFPGNMARRVQELAAVRRGALRRAGPSGSGPRRVAPTTSAPGSRSFRASAR